MPKQPETLFKEKVLKDLSLVESSWFYKTQQVCLRGIPDIVGLVRGKFVALELKKDKTARIDKLQIYVLEQIKKAGGFTAITYPENWQETLERVKSIT